MKTTMNPLLEDRELPRFSAFRPEYVEPAVKAVLEDNRQQVAALLDALERGDIQASQDELLAPLEELDDRLSRVWSPVRHLNAVASTDELRAAHDAVLPLLSDYATELGQNRRLYEAYVAVRDSAEFAAFDPARSKMVTDALREFELSGVALQGEAQAAYRETARRLSELSSRFSNNVLDATQGWYRQVLDVEELAGLSDSALATARQLAAQRQLDGWLLTLDHPSYLPLMTCCDNRELRREVYEAFVTRASDQGPQAGRWDNSETMAEILALRHEQARLLGFDNYAALSVARKMARSTAEVMEFLELLVARSRSAAAREFADIEAYARQELGLDEVRAWDVSWVAERMRKARYDLSQDELRPWFPLPRVLDGLFEISRRLFGVEVRAVRGRDVWHEDVACFDLLRDGAVIAHCYMDLYARQHKRGGAWMDECRVRRLRAGALQLPAAWLTCNFTAPVDGQSALLTHDEVLTLFHEFGHGLHHMLTRVEVGAVSGINGVEWDAVELPSQFLENWCWDAEALGLISGHFETGEPLPEALLTRMLEGRNFNAAMAMVRQLEFALFDFRLHLEYDPAAGVAQVQRMLEEVRRDVAPFPVPVFYRFAHAFSHIFAGGYAAGYYSYKWAEVLSADAFGRFREEGVFNRQTGQSFLENVLEQGGSRPAGELYRAFRGRDAQVEALLQQDGILEVARSA